MVGTSKVSYAWCTIGDSYAPTFLPFRCPCCGSPRRGNQEQIKENQPKLVSEDDLRKQLITVPDPGLNPLAAANLYAFCEQKKELPAIIGPNFFFDAVPIAKFTLPWQKGQESVLSKEAAERLHVLSSALRENMQKATPHGKIEPDADKLRAMLSQDEWHKPEAIPTLLQLLQAESKPLRLLLVETLAGINGEKASIAIAERAVYDLSPEVRKKALEALVGRTSGE